jgi:parallel beta-helix repeat protein
VWSKAFSSGRRKSSSAARPRVRPQLEYLEDRVVPAVLDVTTLADGTGPGTLRSAIAQANANDAAGDTTNTINLTVAGTYNVGQLGALQIFTNATANQSGLSLTIQNTSGSNVAISGNNLNRVFDINPNNVIANNNAVLGAVTINGVTIENGLAQPGDVAGGSGGGIRDQGPVDLTLNNDVLANNSASADGGGVAMENVTSTKWALTLNNTTVVNNHAGDAGGGIDEDGSGLVNINNSTIADNTTLNQGAGIWLDAIQAGTVFQTANLNVSNSVIRGNTAGMLAGGIGNAGNGTVTLVSSTIVDNTSTGFGGGFGDENAQGTLVVQNSLFQGNKAGTNGGGIQAAGPSTTITNSEFKGNAAGINGGMPIGSSGGKPNTVMGSGGGLFIDGGALTLTGSTIADNTATLNGAGIELDTTAASTITNTTIVGNTALNNAGGNLGGGIDDAATGSVALVDDTITNNFAANGGGLFFAGMTGLTIQNTILAQNLASGTGPDFDFTGAITGVDLGGNLIGIGNPAIFTAATTQQGTANMPLNPLVTGLSNNGGPLVGATGTQMTLETEALLPGSPAIGKGVANTILTDERGAPRINTFDVGAFQFENAKLQLTIGTQVTLGLGNSETVTITVTNTSGNPLPSDGSTLTVTATGGLNIGGPLTFAVGPLAAGQSQTFSFNATGVGLGGQTLTVTVISPDTNPTATSASTTVNVVPHTTPPTPPTTPSTFQAALTLFIDAVELVLSQHGFPGLPSSSALFASIQTNLPFAGGLGIQALIAGVNAANNALGNT